MSENISKRPDLLIVSDTAVYKDPDGRIVAFEPVVREIENIAHLFGSIKWLAFQYPYMTQNYNVRTVQGVEIDYVLMDAVGGKGLYQKFRIILTYFRLLFIVPYYINRADTIHTRGPSHQALVAIIYSIIGFRNKIFWHKYAGNWIREEDPLSYKINKYLLRKARRTKVTINGQWPDQPDHMLSFENPCLTEEERIKGERTLKAKNYDGVLEFVFIGQLTENKGVGRIIEAFRQLKNDPRTGMLNLVGDGPERAKYEKLAGEAGINCRFYGFLPRKEVNKVLASCHVLLLPSESEGFPKVVAEGANYGCIPVVTDISCLSQYINDSINGFIISSPATDELVKVLHMVIAMDGSALANIARNAYGMGEKFTYDYYNNRIKNEILKQDC